jgi:Caspase domain
MRIDAASFASTVRAVAVGVDHLPCAWLPDLAAPERDASALAAALRDPAGCAVPSGQIECLTGKTASRASVLDAIAKVAASAETNSILFIYFAGHGVDANEDFFLCTANALARDLTATAVSGADIERALADVKCRGVLVVLDCCQAASFAERAPKMFRQLEFGDFRILLSSARANQKSWERQDGSGTLFSNHLVAALRGREPVGSGNGMVWFSDLLEGLEQRIAEDMETIARGHPEQEMIFVGAYTSDPLIAVHRGLSLGQIRLQTARYSPAYVRRTVQRTLIALGAAIFFAATVAYGFLRETQYAAEDNGRITIFRGHPDFNLPGYPQRLWTLPYGRENLDLAADRPLRIIGHLGQDVMPLLLAHVRLELRAAALADSGDLPAARRIVLDLLRPEGGATPAQRLTADLLLEIVATNADRDLLKAALLEDRSEVRLAAVRALLRIDPAAGVDAALELAASGRLDVDDLLRRIQAPCRPGLNQYLNEVLRQRRGSEPSNRLVLDAALRTGCRLSPDALLLAVDRAMLFETWEVVEYAKENGEAAALGEAVRRALSGDPSSLERTNLLYALAEIRDGPCPQAIRDALRDHERYTKAAAIWAYGALCGGARSVHWVASRNALALSVTAENATTVSIEFSLLVEEEQAEVAYFLDALPSPDRIALTGSLFPAIAQHVPDSDARGQEIIVLALLAAGTNGALPDRLTDSNSIDLRRVAAEYERRRDQSGLVGRLLQRIGGDDEFYVEQLGRIPLQGASLDRLVEMLGGSAPQRRQAACALAMQAAPDRVISLLVDPDPDIRGSALDCASFNGAAGTILAKLPLHVGSFLIDGRSSFAEQVRLKAALEARLATASPSGRLLIAALTDVTPGSFGLWGQGMRYWLAEYRYQLALQLPQFTVTLLLQ